MIALDLDTRVLILTTFDADEYVYEALRAGASGFLLKDAPPDQLIAAVRVLAAGDALIDPSITRRLISRFTLAARTPDPNPPVLDRLTPRERDVLRLVARGLSNAEIAGQLVIEENTVKTHVSRILMKLHLRDRVQAVVLAYESGFVTPTAATRPGKADAPRCRVALSAGVPYSGGPRRAGPGSPSSSHGGWNTLRWS